MEEPAPLRPEIAPQVECQPRAGCAVLTEIVAKVRDGAVLEGTGILPRRVLDAGISCRLHRVLDHDKDVRLLITHENRVRGKR
jgi:hypothetical protein